LGRNLGEIPFGNKIGFCNLQRLWKFVQGDLGGILRWGFCLNSSRLLKDFQKIKHNMPCNASSTRLFLWKDFYMHGKLICNLSALLCWQNFILAKSECYKVESSPSKRRILEKKSGRSKD
jgi:hypothetical protein